MDGGFIIPPPIAPYLSPAGHQHCSYRAGYPFQSKKLTVLIQKHVSSYKSYAQLRVVVTASNRTLAFKIPYPSLFRPIYHRFSNFNRFCSHYCYYVYQNNNLNSMPCLKTFYKCLLLHQCVRCQPKMAFFLPPPLNFALSRPNSPQKLLLPTSLPIPKQEINSLDTEACYILQFMPNNGSLLPFPTAYNV